MTMEQVITRAAKIIHNRIEWNSLLRSKAVYSKMLDDNETIDSLTATYNSLNRLLESKPTDNNRSGLFCRRLGRLMDNNLLFTKDLCIELYDDISYVLEESSVRHDKRNWMRFLARMKFEAELEQRQLQVTHSIGTVKKLNQLYLEHADFLITYIQKCISLHSKMLVRELIENVDRLLCRTCNQKETLLTPQSREHLHTELKCIKINFDCSGRRLKTLLSPSSTFDQSNNTPNYSHRNFLPSVSQLKFETIAKVQSIESALSSQRWFVILGDPGSAKTTLLRWITRVFAEAALRGKERVVLKEVDLGPIRIPILIQIGEFAEWLNQHPTSTLIDYIGKHTWFRESYIGEAGINMLKEFIVNGHALILLDGLDEIPEARQREEIVDLIRTFIHEYVRAPNFISAFDNAPLDDSISLELQSPKSFGGNQVIVTSRIVGYHLYPLNGSFVEHSLLLSMNKEESNQFVTEWIKQIEHSINDILVKEGMELGRDLQTLIKKQYDALNMMLCSSATSLVSNPLILSVICMSMFNSSDEFLHKSRIQVYDFAAQSAVRTWESLESNISKTVLIDVLIDLAAFLHLRSPSGLIDEFDLKQLCYSTLKQQGLSHSNTELREYAKELTCSLGHHVGIIAERGLQVFGFLHLSFQEYFVARSLVRCSPIDEITQRILAFTINPRFREPLLLALGWISWKYSFDDYEKFCDILITQTGNFIYPLGALLLFDAFEDIQTLPSNSILFAALNSLLDHPFSSISIGYFGKNLSKLCKDTQMEWIQSHLTDEKRLLSFCQCLLYELKRYRKNTQSIVSKLISPAIIHHLWTFRNKSTSIEYIIDKTLQEVMRSNISLDHIFEDKLSSHYRSLDNWKSDIHPLVCSVIIAVCGGFRVISEKTVSKLEFSPKYIHNKSSVLEPINEYLVNTKELHSIKIQRLIRRYESILQKSTSTDVSADIVDTFVALICLRGLSQLAIYEEFSTHQAFPLAIHRFKRISLYLIKLYNAAFDNKTSKQLITSEVETIIKMFFWQSNQHNEQLMEFSLACAAALQKLETNCWQNLLNFDIYRNRGVDRYLELQPEFCHHKNYDRDYDQISSNIHRLQMFQDTPLFLLTFVPQTLQDLYKLLIIEPVNKTDSLPLVVLLSESLMLIENIANNNPIFFFALIILQPLFKQNNLENYALALLWENKLPFGCDNINRGDFLRAVNSRGWSNPFSQYVSNNWELLIDQEMQRIDEAKHASHNQDLQLFAATISLARLFQAKYRSHTNKATKDIVYLSLSTSESETVCSAIKKMTDPVIQMLALSTILDLKEPFIFDEEQRNDLKWKMLSPLKDLPQFPLLTATLLFVRCHPVRQFYSEHFQQISNSIIKQLNSEFIDKQSQEAAYIALRMFSNSDLSHSLSTFEKRTMNLSDLREFNSVIFFRYFTNTNSFELSNINLLSSMYLAELSVDVEILKIYTSQNQKRKMPPLAELYQLLNDSLTSGKIMTFEAATWIENNVQLSNKSEIAKIIEWISTCYIAERKALPAFEKWLQYRADEDLKFFAHYAALQLAKDGRNFPHLIEIINELFDCEHRLVFERITRDLLQLEVVDFTSTREIFVTLIQGAYRSSIRTSASVRSKEILNLILELELQRINSTILQRTGGSARSYLYIIDSCSPNVQLHLIEHLYNCINVASNAQNPVQEDYLAIAMKWMIMGSLWNNEAKAYPPEVLECIYTFLRDKRFPQVQKAIANSINVLFFKYNLPKEHVFMENDVMNNLEQVIHSYAMTMYSYTDDVLAACLLAYGNGLLRLQRVEIDRIVSDKTSSLLKTLVQRSPSHLIAARAGLCYIFSQTSNATRSIIFSLINRSEISPETSYNILLQQTLYQMIDHDLHEEVKIVTQYLRTCSREVIGKFVVELYDYLGKTDITNYLSDSTPDYLNVAIHFIDENFDIFLHTLQESTFGEQNFKTAIYHANQRTHNDMFLVLYASFGVITKEFVAMLACYKDHWSGDIWECLRKIKEISDRDTVEYLFSILETTFHLEMLRLIVQFAKADVISPLEVHQRVSDILRNISHKNDEMCLIFKRQLFRGLMNLSCIEQDQLSVSEIELYTTEQTDMDSAEEYLYLDQMAPLFLRRKFFMHSVSLVMNYSTEENYPNFISDSRISANLSDQ